MGIFSRILGSHPDTFGASTSSKSVRENTATQENDALNFFDDQIIKCSSDADTNALIELYIALKIDNYDTYDDTNIKDALSSLDANVYNLCKAIIYQNFMLMRKVDKLNERISKLEEEKE